jgi:hypothetical protein
VRPRNIATPMPRLKPSGQLWTGLIRNPWAEVACVQAFNRALLPGSLRPLVEDTAERMQVPLDYPVVVAILCLAGVTNGRAAIQPKAAAPFAAIPCSTICGTLGGLAGIVTSCRCS